MFMDPGRDPNFVLVIKFSWLSRLKLKSHRRRSSKVLMRRRKDINVTVAATEWPIRTVLSIG